MIVIFKSRAAGDVIMFGDVAHRLMKIMGKEASPSGTVTLEQLPGAIAALKAAIETDKAQRVSGFEDDLPTSEPDGAGGRRSFVSLAQRATPLLELLEWSMKKKKPVVWGV